MHLRSSLVAAATALSLSACALAPLPGAPTAAPTAMTPFTWKGNTPRITRGRDINECELAARGLPPNATPEMMAAAVSSNPAQEARFVRACLTNKGYTVTQLPVCNDALRRGGTLVVQPEILPPLASIRCADPVNRGLIVG